MVGVPRSNGCRLCVQRRVKCDQSRPACENCLRYGAPCPGYNHERKFVTNKHHIRPRRGRGRGTQPSGAGTNPSRTPPQFELELAQSKSSSSSNSATLETASSPLARNLSGRSHGVHSQSRVPASLLEPRGPYISSLLETLHSGLSGDELSFLSPWFQGMEERVGNKVTLDSAVMSLVLQMLGRRFNDHRLIGESHLLYGRSLKVLQLALHSQSEWKTTETLCATGMLCHFEMFAGTGNSLSWMKHADAMSLLIESRGPDAYVTDWDLSIFNTSRTAIIFNCFWSGKDCFFADPLWEHVLQNGSNTQGLSRGSDLEAQRRELVNDYVIILAKIPGIMRHIYPLFQSRSQGLMLPTYAQSLSTLGDRIDEIYQSLILWSGRLYNNMAPPVEIATSDESSPWPTVLAYENVWFGALYMGFWTVRLILQMGLELIKDKDATFEDTQTLVSNILRSCETVGEGIMGPYRIGFGIRCAYDVADAPTRLWIKSKLAKFQETSASLDAGLFISPDERQPS